MDVLNAVVRAFKTPDLRRKILFTLAVMALFRIGSFIPTPGISYTNVQQCLNLVQAEGGADLLGLVNMLSGGALLQLSIFALGIMPYITASIIVQLLTVVIPHFETLKKEGQSGQAKMTQYTRYLSIGLAVLQSTTYIAMARAGSLFPGCTLPIIPNDTVWMILIMILTMTAGTGLIMWMGETITERGIGNGMSLLIFTSIAAGFPASFGRIISDPEQGWGAFAIVVVVGLVILTAVVFVEQSQRRIPVQYAKKMIGRRSYGGSSTYIPIKVNQAGVIPVIFASSMLYLPALVAQFNTPSDPTQPRPDWVDWINNNMTRGDHWLYMLIYFVLIIFFTYFYVAITFEPTEIADNIKRVGGFVPGIRAGRPTAEYLGYVLDRITAPGSLYLGIVSLIPLVAISLVNADQSFPFGGTSILIVVGVGLETVKQLQSQLEQRHYEGFLR